MILSKPDITKELEEGKLRIEPRPEKIAQVSVNLRLGHVFTTFKKLKPHYPVVEITDSLLEEDALWDSRELPHYDLEPQGFVLAQTYETVTIPNTMMGFVEGRSSWARMGINVQAAPKIDPVSAQPSHWKSPTSGTRTFVWLQRSMSLPSCCWPI